jgi:hypothetical protein
MIGPDEYPQVERHAGDRVTQRQSPDPQRASAAQGRAINSIAAKLTHMSGDYVAYGCSLMQTIFPQRNRRER